MKQRTGQRTAFTLIELLVVIAVVGILTSVTVSVIGITRERSDSVRCVNNLRQLHVATRMWSQDNENGLPNWQSWYNDLRTYVAPTVEGSEWVYGEVPTLLSCPLMNNSWKSYNQGQRTYAMNHRTGVKSNWDVRWDYFSRPASVLHYIDGVFAPHSSGRHTYRPVVYPDSGTGNIGSWEFYHNGKANAVFMDGHVETIDRQRVNDVFANRNSPDYPYVWGTQ